MTEPQAVVKKQASRGLVGIGLLPKLPSGETDPTIVYKRDRTKDKIEKSTIINVK